MHNMKLRRDFAWQIVDQMLQPTTIKLPGSGAQVDVPLWQTWYEGRGSEVGKSNDELTGLITSFFEKLKKNPSADLATTADQALNEQAMKDLAQSVTVQNMTAVLRQNAGIPTKFGGQGTTLFSPSFVKHMMVMARQVENCSHKGITPATQPPSPDNFSHCIKEFPRDAVMVKTAWIDLEDGVAVHDTSPAGMTAVINEGTWPGGSFHPATPKTVKPAPGTIYTNETEEGRQFGLAAIHLVTKDVREWVWVSLWWSPDPASDFGADRPDGIAKYNGGVWSNYKMCVVSSFDEGDLQPWSHYSGKQETLGRSIRATFDAIQAHVTKGVTGNIIIGVDDATSPRLGERSLGRAAQPGHELVQQPVCGSAFRQWQDELYWLPSACADRKHRQSGKPRKLRRGDDGPRTSIRPIVHLQEFHGGFLMGVSRPIPADHQEHAEKGRLRVAIAAPASGV